MTDMYLLFEWTEEREAKMHLGIFTSIEKAKAAALISWKNDGKQRGATEEELEEFTLNWADEKFGTIGTRSGPEDEDLTDLNDEQPYEIEVFQLDLISTAGEYNQETRSYDVEIHTL